MHLAHRQLRLVLLVVLWTGTAGVRADDEDRPAPRLPVAGRPEFFDEEDGPIGSFQTPSIRVDPREVQVEDAVTVTIRVAAAGPVQRPPKQLRLEKFPGFTEQFYIEYPDDPTFHRVDAGAWEFTCTLKPRNTRVAAIPSFPIVFFTPGFLPPERGYQVRRTASVPIIVRPRAAVKPSAVHGGQEPPPFPEAVYQLAPSDAVLRRARTCSREQLLLIGGLGLLLPPVACVAWCMAWRRRHPEAAHHLRKRRNQAAQQALTSLRHIKDKADLQTVVAIVTEYLRQRYDSPIEELTPAEVRALLAAAGCAADQIEPTVTFFRNSEAVRFARAAPPGDVAAAARRVILTLEADLCPSPASF